MASSLWVLLDDIATIMDDVAVMTKVAMRKTAGVLGDDLALNAQQVSGVKADRELPVVWAVAKGSAKNKLILVPAALAISALMPWAVIPLLMLGGAYLCYEGCEKLAHKFLHSDAAHAEKQHELLEAVANPEVDLVAFEKEKIQGAIRTDFILSAEIIVIALGTVSAASFGKQLAVLAGIAAIMTVGVYGLVAGIVKLDDLGLHLSQKQGPQRSLGRAILWTAPYLMKTLSVVGTAAMFMVGGGILVHGWPAAHHLVEDWAHQAASLPALGTPLAFILPTLLNGLAGIIAGAVILGVISLIGPLLKRQTA